MRSRRLCLIGLGLLAVSAPGRSEPGPVPAGKSVAPNPGEARIVQALESAEPDRRATAFAAMRERGGVGGRTYAALLAEARVVHRHRLESLVSEGLDRVHAFAEAEGRWRDCKSAALKSIMTDWHKEPAKIARLTDAFQETERWTKALERHLRTVAEVRDDLVPVAKALREIEIEQAWCDVPGASPTGRSRREYLADVRGGDALNDVLKRWQDRSAAAVALDRVAEHHKRPTKWAGRPLVDFASILNWRRHVMGLAPLRLDERLSAAAEGHSAEMRDRGYFAHESPVEGNNTPERRARNASFEGQWTGENIFMGSESPEAAFEGWWASDGHRFIMFQTDANTLGLGLAGPYWTLNTGNRNWADD